MCTYTYTSFAREGRYGLIKFLFSAFYAFLLCVGGFLILNWFGWNVARALESKWMELTAVSILFSAGLSVLLYMKSYEAQKSELSHLGSSGTRYALG